MSMPRRPRTKAGWNTSARSRRRANWRRCGVGHRLGQWRGSGRRPSVWGLRARSSRWGDRRNARRQQPPVPRCLTFPATLSPPNFESRSLFFSRLPMQENMVVISRARSIRRFSRLRIPHQISQASCRSLGSWRIHGSKVELRRFQQACDRSKR